jgi:hypothetical protein
VVLQVRPGEEVVDSLVRRDGMDPELGALLWARSVIEAEQWSRSCRRCWITLAALAGDQEAALQSIACGLGLAWPAASATLPVDGRKSRGAPVARRGASWLLRSVWAAVQEAVLADDGRSRARFDALRAMLREMDAMQIRSFARAHAARDAMLEAMLRSTSWRITAPLRAARRLLGR